MVEGCNSYGIQICGSDLLDHFQFIVTIVQECIGILAQLQELKPFHHDVGVLQGCVAIATGQVLWPGAHHGLGGRVVG